MEQRTNRQLSCRWESHLFHMPGGSMYYVYITLRPDRIRSILANTRNNVAMTILRFESDEIIQATQIQEDTQQSTQRGSLTNIII